MLIETELAMAATMPWVMGVLGAIGFGLLARLLGRNAIAWAIGGGCLTFLMAAYLGGLAHATSVPYSDDVRRAGQFRVILLTVVFMGAIGAGIWYWSTRGRAWLESRK